MTNNDNDKNSSFNGGNRNFRRSDRTPAPHYRQVLIISPSLCLINSNIQKNKKLFNTRVMQSQNYRRRNGNLQNSNRHNDNLNCQPRKQNDNSHEFARRENIRMTDTYLQCKEDRY